MFCVECGYKIEYDGNFCESCGSKIVSDISQKEQKLQSSPSDFSTNPSSKNEVEAKENLNVQSGSTNSGKFSKNYNNDVPSNDISPQANSSQSSLLRLIFVLAIPLVIYVVYAFYIAYEKVSSSTYIPTTKNIDGSNSALLNQKEPLHPLIKKLDGEWLYYGFGISIINGEGYAINAQNKFYPLDGYYQNEKRILKILSAEKNEYRGQILDTSGKWTDVNIKIEGAADRLRFTAGSKWWVMERNRGD